MTDKQMRRRDFMKLAVASTVAQGLSHFRFLNFSGVSAVGAFQEGPEHEACLSSVTGICSLGDACTIMPQDLCQAPFVDTCVEPGVDDCDPLFGGDTCVPPADPDVCDAVIDPEDICDPAIGEPDNTAVTLTHITTKSANGVVLGGVVALLSGAALWVKNLLQKREAGHG